MRFGFHSLRMRLALSVGLLVTAVTVFVALFFPAQQRMAVDEIFAQRGFMMAETVARLVRFAAEFDDVEVAKTALRPLTGDQAVVYATLLRKNDSTLAAIGRSKARAAKAQTVSDRAVIVEGTLMHIGVPLENELGSLWLGLSLESVIERQERSNRIALLVCFSMMLGGFVWAWWLGSRVARPITQITNAAQRIAEDDLSGSVPDVRGHDEVAQLAQAFAGMQIRLQILASWAREIADGRLRTDMVGAEVSGDMAGAFAAVGTWLQTLSMQATSIAQGDLDAPVLKQQLPGELGVAIAQMVRSLHTLAEQASTIAAGDFESELLSQELPGELGVAFGEMKRNLRDSIERMKSASELVGRAASDILDAMHEVDNNAKEQASRTQDSSSSIVELSLSIQAVADNAERAAAVATEGFRAAQDGTESVRSTIHGMRTVARDVDSTADSIQQLDINGRAIGRIVEFIADIANQSNLLGLNAAIEAARAGERGRWFTVVADEVAKLASRSAKATKEITELIKATQAMTEASVRRMEKGQKAVSQAMATADRSESALATILEVVHQMTQAASEISKATGEQGTSALHAARSIEAITQQAAESAGATTQVMQRAEELARLSEELRYHAGRFSVQSGY